MNQKIEELQQKINEFLCFYEANRTKILTNERKNGSIERVMEIEDFQHILQDTYYTLVRSQFVENHPQLEKLTSQAKTTLQEIEAAILDVKKMDDTLNKCNLFLSSIAKILTVCAF